MLLPNIDSLRHNKSYILKPMMRIISKIIKNGEFIISISILFSLFCCLALGEHEWLTIATPAHRPRPRPRRNVLAVNCLNNICQNNFVKKRRKKFFLLKIFIFKTLKYSLFELNLETKERKFEIK